MPKAYDDEIIYIIDPFTYTMEKVLEKYEGKKVSLKQIKIDYLLTLGSSYSPIFFEKEYDEQGNELDMVKIPFVTVKKPKKTEITICQRRSS